MSGDQLPVLQVVLPLIGAPICLLLRARRACWVFALAVAWTAFGLALALAGRVLTVGTVSYALGGWPAPWGIEYHVDLLNVILLLVVSGIGAAVLSYAPASAAHEIPAERHYLFLAAYLLALSGLLGISITGDLFNVFVFLEISSLSSYALVALGRDRRALTAALRYLVMGTIGATFILIGIGLLYMTTGTLNMADVALRLPSAGGRTVHVAFAFFTVGLGLKMALFPLHLWLPDAYTRAPSVVSAFLAGTTTKVAVYLLIRICFSVFHRVPLADLLMVLALAAMLIPSIVAVFQTNLKRLLAYSSLGQIGYMVLGVSFQTATGLTGGIVHVFNHALIKSGMFLAVGCMVLRVGSAELDDLAGIGRRMPWTTGAWVVGGLGLVGVPATAGFVSKWYLVSAALEGGHDAVAILLLLSSLVALVYVGRFVEIAYFREPAASAAAAGEAPRSMLAVSWAFALASIWFGLDTRGSAALARRAAEMLVGALT